MRFLLRIFLYSPLHRAKELSQKQVIKKRKKLWGDDFASASVFIFKLSKHLLARGTILFRENKLIKGTGKYPTGNICFEEQEWIEIMLRILILITFLIDKIRINCL